MRAAQRALLACLAACRPSDQAADARFQRLQARDEIAQVIRLAKDCNRRRDIDCFIHTYDSAFILESNEAADSNRTITLDSLRRDVLRDWGIVDTMYEVEQWIDSLFLAGTDTAIVYTNQFYHRTFRRPAGQAGIDDVVTTQKHREIWVRRSAGWKLARVRELGGAIYVNGKPFNPDTP